MNVDSSYNGKCRNCVSSQCAIKGRRLCGGLQSVLRNGPGASLRGQSGSVSRPTGCGGGGGMIDVSQRPGWWKAPGGKWDALLGRLFTALALVFAVALPVGAVFAFTTQVAGASTDTVTNCNDSGAGSLRQTVADASAGNTIDFDLSPACSVITLTSGYIEVTQNLTIDGPGASTLAVSGDDEGGVFVVDSGVTTTISGLTIEDAAINDSDADFGTGIANAGTLNVTDCTLSDNSGNFGGGIDNGNGGTLNVTGSTFSGNSVRDDGGGIFSEGESVSVTDSTFSGNGGSAIDNDQYETGEDGTLTVTGSTFSDNTSGDGGAIDSSYAPLTVTDSTLSDNTASASANDSLGGGIASYGGSLTVTGSTLSGNGATPNGQGGGIESDDTTVTVSASKLSGNTASLDGGGMK